MFFLAAYLAAFTADTSKSAIPPNTKIAAMNPFSYNISKNSYEEILENSIRQVHTEGTLCENHQSRVQISMQQGYCLQAYPTRLSIIVPFPLSRG